MYALLALFQTTAATLPDTSVLVLFQKGGISLLVGLLVVLGAAALRRSTLPGFGFIIATGLLLIAW
ncbi:MAG: hypothetical protein KFH87_09270, partial [Bacteroidetes bacterium]|nr:hypothetical protein [Bacteroidota bacterium]